MSRRNIIRSKKARINQQIGASRVRLIAEGGAQVGIVSIQDALSQAVDAGLDLVEISPNDDPPVCRIMNYGKYLFDQNQRKKEQKRNQKTMQVKEVKFRPGTDIGDFQIKMRKIQAFLSRGDKVKISLRFKGREMQHKELGLDLLERVKAELPAGFVIEQAPQMEGRQMIMVVLMGKVQQRTEK